MCRSKLNGGRRCPGTGKGNVSRSGNHSGSAAGVSSGLRLEERHAAGGEGQPEQSMDGSGHRDGTSPGVLSINGKNLITVATHAPTSARADALRELGYPTPTLYELDPKEAGEFRGMIAALKDGNKFSASVYVYDEEEYADMRLLITDDGKSGIAINDGDELVSVFSLNDSPYKGCSKSLVAQSVELGVTRLDCYDTVLPRIYASEGFLPVARMEWNDEYAPDDWEHSTYDSYNGGRPDVVFMKYDPTAVDTNYKTLEEDSRGVYVDDYDDGTRLSSS